MTTAKETTTARENVASTAWRPATTRERSTVAETTTASERPRRRRPRVYESTTVSEARRRRYPSRNVMEEAGDGLDVPELALALGSGALSFIAADALDRFLATYDPTAATKPTDRFTSDGAGTLANTLNVASAPDWTRWASAIAFAGLPLAGSIAVEEPTVRSGLEGAAIGGGIHLAKLLWTNVVMPLLAPSDTSTAGLQKSTIARLYPAEIAAAINVHASPPQQSLSSSGSGALSGADVGPFALSAESEYQSAHDALRRSAGLLGPGGIDFPSLQNTWGTGEFPTAAQAMMGVGAAAADATHAVMAALPGIPPAAAAQAAGAAIAHPHNIHGALVMVLPHVPVHVLMECARMVSPHVARAHAAAAAIPAAAAPAPNFPVATAPVAPPAAGGQPPPVAVMPSTGTSGWGMWPGLGADPAATGTPMATSMSAVPVASVPVGPPPLPVVGPRANSPEHAPEGCACLGDDNPFLGFVGDAEEDPPPAWSIQSVGRDVLRSGGLLAADRK